MILTAAELVDATQEELPPDIPSFVEAHLVYGESTFRILRHRHEALGMKRISVVIRSVLTIAGIVLASDC